MGAGKSKGVDKHLDSLPEHERYFGLENFGNTCYCNSVLQALYFCRAFRERLIAYHRALGPDPEDNLLTCLAELFAQISSKKGRTGVVPPKRFVQRLKKENEIFRSYMHQDAHEFLNYLFNRCSELLEKEAAAASRHQPRPQAQDGGKAARPPTWIQQLFQGALVNQTRCLQCETLSSREEEFFELSLEIEQNSSLTACLRNFSATETLAAEDKFWCERCGGKQEAHKRIAVARLPPVLCLHLKRFKLRKLMYRVVFPFELKLRNTTAECGHADDCYALAAVVVHVGSGPNHGHYVSFVKSADQWLLFDDDLVDVLEEADVRTAFGTSQEYASSMQHGYILLYERQPTVGRPAASEHEADG